jgi:hypothetical protein
MTTIFAIVLFFIFLGLSLIHFYWLLGGTWGIEKAIPTDENGHPVLNPSKIATITVALALFSFTLFYLSKGNILTISFYIWIQTYGGWIISGIFILRAIGDFRYIGFFKKIKNTNFAKADTRYFAPLCLSIGCIGILIELIN